ncbi:hypothetical protein SSX86_021611 [Deinandra increscens subsp. villosa]|uniref:AAA+ ATPase domain-containing protein n=1 Tax=Deinandra increscens subsp. villosa TaxID=3103831 RepID=A0AAP0GQ70_9ASTR
MGKPPVRSSLSGKLLRRRIEETYGSSTPSINEVMGSLRAKYPEYRWQKPQLLSRLVKQTLDSDEDGKGKRRITDEDSRSTKKAKQIDIREQMLETKHVAGGWMELQSELSDSVSTCEDDSRLEFDLTKSMIRDKYRRRSKTKTKTKKKVDHFPAAAKVGSNGGPRLKDIGGMDDILKELKLEVILPLVEPELLAILGVSPVAGILFHGPPGCGKTRLARAIANEAGVPFYKVSSTDLVSGVSGASEESIRELFSKAYATAPSIVFIDEIDAIASKRENLQREMEKRIVTQLMTCMEEDTRDVKLGHVLVIGATNRPDALDPALRRPGRFDREIRLDVPDESARIKILSLLTRDVKLDANFDPVKISRATPGFVGADLAALVNKAGLLALSRTVCGRESTRSSTAEQNEEEDDDSWRKLTPKEKADLIITMSDIEEATKRVQPSSKREGFATIPNVKWEDVGGLHLLRTEFHRHIVNSIKYSYEYEASGISSHTGFLLYGPHGCGKTLIAKAVANEAGANFIHIEGPELMSKYVGETEKAVRTIFSHARTCSPCIIFFDEVDALATKRGNEGAWVVERPLMQLMLELDGGNQRKGVYVIGATNRPEVIDRALLRPGRLGKHMYVSLPNQEERGLIVEALSRNKHLDADVDLIAIARSEACANFSGADLSDLMNEAALAALEEHIIRTEAAAHEGTSVPLSQSFVPAKIKAVHIERAFRKIKPSVSDKEIQYYDLMAKRFSAS